MFIYKLLLQRLNHNSSFSSTFFAFYNKIKGIFSKGSKTQRNTSVSKYVTTHGLFRGNLLFQYVLLVSQLHVSKVWNGTFTSK